jgi:hypothetical protein
MKYETLKKLVEELEMLLEEVEGDEEEGLKRPLVDTSSNGKKPLVEKGTSSKKEKVEEVEDEDEVEELEELSNYERKDLLIIAKKAGIKVEDSWTDKKLRDVIESKLEKLEEVEEKEEEVISRKKKESASGDAPGVGDMVMVLNDNDEWVEEKVVRVKKDDKIFETKNWELEVAKLGSDWKFKK